MIDHEPKAIPGVIGFGECPNCKAQIPFEWKRCPECGFKVSWHNWDTECKKFEGGTYDAQH